MRKVFMFFIMVVVMFICIITYARCDLTPIDKYSEDDTIVITTNTTETKIETTVEQVSETTIEKTTEKTTQSDVSKTEAIVKNNTSVGIFDLTYYIPRPDQSATGLCGGSGRELIDCSVGNSEVKGSVACKRVVDTYGYMHNGKRTIIYIDVPELPELTGYYYVDDCCGSNCVIDLYYSTPSNCPFENIGVIHNAMCYVVSDRYEKTC